MSIVGVTYSNQKVSAADHAKLFQMLIGDGILNGCSASARLNVFTISEGKFITAGRVAKIQGSEAIPISTEYPSGWYARVKLVNDLSQAAEIDEFKQVKFEIDYAETISGFTPIVQENINEDGSTGKYEIVWAILTLGANGVITAYDIKVGPATGGGGGGTGQPIFTFTPDDGSTGGWTLVDDGNGDWRIKFLKSGILVFTGLGNASGGIDIFLVGGGGGSTDTAGGGGGYTMTATGYILSVGSEYHITVGSGGAAMTDGEPTIAFGYSANGGKAASNNNGGNGGSGGSAYAGPAPGQAVGGSDGANGPSFYYDASHNYVGGTGQETTTREFGENNGDLYSGGGAGASTNNPPTAYQESLGGEVGGGKSGQDGDPERGSMATPGQNGAVNTGGGGGAKQSSGGSGIVIIRNHRTTPAA